MKSKLQLPNWTFKPLDLSSPKVMGILNLTPDSFFDGGKYKAVDRAVEQAERMLGDGASILDVGAFSTRPYADLVDENEEWSRLKNILIELRKRFPGHIISVDTYRSTIALKAIEAGADMINDISGGSFDDEMFSLIATQKVPYVLMHIAGTPQTMQQDPDYKNVVKEVDDFFLIQLAKLKALGFDQNIILDPGFGFGKTVAHNYQLLHRLNFFSRKGFPVLAGVSRKSMINKVLGTKPEDALNGTTALHMLALNNGAALLRAHDVKEAVEAIKIFTAYQGNAPE